MSSNLDFADETKQVARAALRENFLKRLTALRGSKCNIMTHEMTFLNGTFKGFDVDVQEILVSDLQTPSCSIPDAILRANDIISMEFSETDDASVK